MTAGAHCVISLVIDTEDRGGAPPGQPACAVHIHWAPCPLNGTPARGGALHADDVTGGARALWWTRTHGQRPLVIHHGLVGDAEHDLDSAACWCAPDVHDGVPCLCTSDPVSELDAETVPPDPAVMPGGPGAIRDGCTCDPVDNRDGQGVGGVPVYVGEDGVARGYDSPLYLVDVACPVHPMPVEAP